MTNSVRTSTVAMLNTTLIRSFRTLSVLLNHSWTSQRKTQAVKTKRKATKRKMISSSFGLISVDWNLTGSLRFVDGNPQTEPSPSHRALIRQRSESLSDDAQVIAERYKKRSRRTSSPWMGHFPAESGIDDSGYILVEVKVPVSKSSPDQYTFLRLSP